MGLGALFFFLPNEAAAQVASASIQVTVAQPQPVAAGTNFDYVVNVSNEGLDDAAKLEDVQVFHAGTKLTNGKIRTAGGRVLAVTALGSTIKQARERAYEAVSRIQFENCQYRRDIALSVVAANVEKLS